RTSLRDRARRHPALAARVRRRRRHHAGDREGRNDLRRRRRRTSPRIQVSTQIRFPMSTIDRQAIIETLSRLVTPGIKLTALADELGARKPQYAALRELILDLVEDGTVQVLPGGAFALAPSGRPGDPGARPVPSPRSAPARPAKQSKSPATAK